MIFALVIASVFASFAVTRAASSSMDACADVGSRALASTSGLTIGIAYWPSGTVDDWGNLTHPCVNATYLAVRGVGVATYVADASGMTAMRATRADEDGIFALASSARQMTVVAYTANEISPPRVIRDGINRASALTLLATLEKGDVKYLRWHDAGCGTCGGVGYERCMDVGDGDHACAASEAGCDGTCAGDACDVELGTSDALRCQLTVNVALSGSDINGEVFKFGTQLARLSKYGSSGAYYSAVAKATAAANGVLGFFG